MANVGKGVQGKTFIGKGYNSSPSFEDIGVYSGLTSKGVVIAQGNDAFEATNAPTDGQVLLGATGANPAFSTLTSSDASITFTVGANSLDLKAVGGSVSPLTTKGDLYTYDTADARLAIGGDGTTLIADSAQATGNKWGVLQEVGGGTAQSTYTTGDILYSSASNTLSKLGIGNFSNDLTVTSSGIPGYKSRRNWVTYYDDFLHYQTGDWSQNKSGVSSASTFQNNATDSDHPGLWKGSTGTDATGNARVQLYEQSLTLGGGQLVFETAIKLSALSDGTDTYKIFIGLSSSTSVADGTHGVYFRYIHSTYSGNWDLVTRASGAETTSDSSTAVTTDWTNLKIIVNAAASLVTFYVNGSSVGTSATNIPTSPIGIFYGIVKSAGTTSRDLFSDYADLNIQLTNTR